MHESGALIVTQCCMLVRLVVKVTSCTTQAPIFKKNNYRRLGADKFNCN